MIVNIDSSTGPGIHWVAALDIGGNRYYNDPLGHHGRSRELYTISSVQGGIDTVPKYRLEEKGDEWYLHHQLQKVEEGIALPPPLDIVKEDMDYEPYEGLSHTSGVRTYRLVAGRSVA